MLSAKSTISQKLKIVKKTSKTHKIVGGPFGHRCLGAADWAPNNWVPCRLGTEIWAPFRVMKKKNEAGNYLNAVEREPVPTRVLNPNTSEASYEPKQRSYRKTKLKKTGNSPAPSSGVRQSRRPNVQRPNGGAQTYPTRKKYFLIKRIFGHSYRSVLSLMVKPTMGTTIIRWRGSRLLQSRPNQTHRHHNGNNVQTVSGAHQLVPLLQIQAILRMGVRLSIVEFSVWLNV